MLLDNQVKSSTRAVGKSYFEMVSGSAGAVPSSFVRARDIESVTLVGTTYVFKFARGCTALVDYNLHVEQATPDKTLAWTARVTVNDIAGSTRSVTVQCVDAAGNSEVLVSGDILKGSFELKTSPGLA